MTSTMNERPLTPNISDKWRVLSTKTGQFSGKFWKVTFENFLGTRYTIRDCALSGSDRILMGASDTLLRTYAATSAQKAVNIPVPRLHWKICDV